MNGFCLCSEAALASFVPFDLQKYISNIKCLLCLGRLGLNPAAGFAGPMLPEQCSDVFFPPPLRWPEGRPHAVATDRVFPRQRAYARAGEAGLCPLMPRDMRAAATPTKPATTKASR